MGSREDEEVTPHGPYSKPSSRDPEVGLGLGAQAGERHLRQVVEEAGFTRFCRRAGWIFGDGALIRPDPAERSCACEELVQ